MDKPKPGESLEELFRLYPDMEIGPFLAYLEQTYRRRGDLEMLREIQGYRKKHPTLQP